MKDEGKTKEQLVNELVELRQRITDLEASETERKQAEEALRESEEKYRSLVVHAPGVIWTTDEHMRVVFVSPNVETVCGHTPEQEYEMGKWMSWYERVHPDDVENVKAAYDALMEGEKHFDIEYRFMRMDGRWIWLHDRSVTVYEKDGAKYADGLFYDITERKCAEEELKRSEEKYRSLILNIPDVAWTSDENYCIVFVSPNVERLTGYTQEEEYQCGDWIKWFDKLHPDDVEYAKNALQEFIEGRKPYDIEYRFKRKDGRWVWIHDRSIETYEKDGKLYADGLLADITERKRAEVERIQMARRVQLNSRLASVGKMASGIAHEVNNPLTSLIGVANLLSQRDLPEAIREDVEIIHEAAQRIGSIINRLLTFARKSKPQRTCLDINHIIETTLALQAYELKTNNIKVITQLDANLPRTMADGHQLQQVFLNIIINAEAEMRLARHKGRLTIRTEAVDNSIRVSFKDNGPGIAKENLGRIFDPFFTTRDVGKGTGLGLSVCHGIVAEHNGRIYAKTQLGKGATFVVELPIIAEREITVGSQAA